MKLLELMKSQFRDFFYIEKRDKFSDDRRAKENMLTDLNYKKNLKELD
jgi:hypothetical protein